MTHFLRAGFLVEALKDLEAGLKELDDILHPQDPDTQVAELRALLNRRSVAGGGSEDGEEAWRRLRQAAQLTRALLRECERANGILRMMPSEPLVYTGPADTETVVRVLERVLAESDQRHEYLEALGRRPLVPR